MIPRFPLSYYIDQALAQAVYEKMDRHTFNGKIPACKGVAVSAPNLRECKEELQVALENWILTGLKKGRNLPIIAGIDLNTLPAPEPKDATGAKKKVILSGREIQHRLVDARVTQKMLVEYLHTHGWETLHESHVSRVLNGKVRMPEKFEPALVDAIDKLRRR